MQSNTEKSGRWKHGRWWRRSLLLVTACVALLWLVGSWVAYRYDHVVTRDAIVRGVVSRVGARIEGRIATVDVEPDQRVFKGDVLARLEDQWQLAQLQQAKAELQRATDTLDNERKMLEVDRQSLALSLAASSAQLQAAKANITAAQSAVKRWGNEVDRITRITRPGTLSRSESDDIHLQHETAMANHLAVEAQHSAAQSDNDNDRVALQGLEVRVARLSVLAEEINVAKAKLATAQADLDSTVIRAPENGWVAQRLAEAGASVRVGYPIVALWTGDRLWVEAWVDESALDDVQVDRAVDVRFAAYPERVIVGRVKAIGVLSDGELQSAAANTRQPMQATDTSKVAVQIMLPAEPGVRLMPGLSAMVGIGTDQPPPLAALSAWFQPAPRVAEK
ncbi:MAG: efflux RND transporter periplasmic adaptor subunit [Planctomycetia bacterium]|nr:efflux RND transporter periplasmic adaptor subunit [Planctomycetia bacterium]